jgi:hypothetical protein
MSQVQGTRFFFGHHRCATSWIDDVLRAVCRDLGLRHVSVHHPRLFGHDLGRFVREQRVDCVAFVNADYRYVEGLEGFRAFHVIRDPRDVSVSAYFSHLYSHRIDDGWPELAERRRRLQGLDKDRGLLAEIDDLEWEFDCMDAWDYGRPEILELKMEDLTGDPYGQFLRIFRFLDLVDERPFSLGRRVAHETSRVLRAVEQRLPLGVRLRGGRARLPAARILGIIWENEFAKKTDGRRSGVEDPRSHYRKGAPGDWRNHFTRDHVARFEARYGTLLRRLGYESDPRWGTSGH